MRYLVFTLFVASLFITAPQAHAGEVFKKKCPFSCKELGLSEAHCKDSKEKKKCSVEIMPGANGNGKVTLKKKCPLSCESMGIPQDRCKDSKEGKACTVVF